MQKTVEFKIRVPETDRWEDTPCQRQLEKDITLRQVIILL
jgi:hypothetical protein